MPSALGPRLSAGALVASLLLAPARSPLAQPTDARPRDAARRAAAALERAARQRQRERNDARYDDVFRKYSKRYFGLGWDWRTFKAQGMAESNLNPTARSYVGARGIMQLMPATYNAISSKNREFQAIDDPEWNIAAGILHDRYLWRYWEKEVPDERERLHFMYGSYNAGQGTIGRAHRTALEQRLDHDRWENIERVAPGVPRWRYRETLGYVRKIRAHLDSMPKQR